MSRALVGVIAIAVLVAAMAGSCARVGDDRFPKLPDADLPDATDFGPDARGPVDAPPAVDAVDAAAPDAP